MEKSQSSSISMSSVANLDAATGPVTVRMANDYLFRALLQHNNRILKSLICSLLHLMPEEVTSAEIVNSVELGEAVDEKEFILDIKVQINSSTIINLEMQVVNEHNWVDRSTCYLCRTYSNLNRGDDYTSAKSVIQIGLLDFTLFPERPEFYATYKLINEKNFSVYSDKLRLSVLDLTHIDLATEEDRQYGIDTWATFFKSATWEELKMLAHNNDDIREATSTVYQLTQEEKIRQRCEAREDYYRRQNDVRKWIKKQEDTIQQQEQQIQQKEQQIQHLKQQIQHLKQQNEQQFEIINQQGLKMDELAKQMDGLRAQIRQDQLKS